ncbi:hypothetical protein ACEUZ9_001125 [Paracoccus litorisediminis]|uniref:hypothetical protein n=1 Tax=Paracoccus litorisediminis TaxID=2006130 RepID=UPI00372F40FD
MRNPRQARHDELRRDIEDRKSGKGRNAAPEAVRGRMSLLSKANALKAAKTGYDRRFVRTLASIALERQIDLFSSFRDAISRAPVTEGVERDPRRLISAPGLLTSDMRIELCRAFCMADDILFAGHYPPPGAATAREIYRMALRIDRPDGVRFMPWLADRLQDAEIEAETGELAAWVRGEREASPAILELIQCL